MNAVVPIILGAAVLLVVALMSAWSSLRSRRKGGKPAMNTGPKILIHSINDERCTGCDACVAVCPTNVLDLVENKSRVLHFEDCIQCEACMWACPTTALVMHPEDKEPPLVKQPDLDGNFQTKVPGQYLIGEVAGKPLVKNAANLGRAVVEHMIQDGLRPSGNQTVDVAIVGSGPGGLSTALTCVNKGLSYLIFDKEHIVASTIARYPKGKLIMAEPYDSPNYSFLPVFDSSKEEMIPIWEDLTARLDIQIKLGEAVETVTRKSNGIFEVKTTQGSYQAQRVVLATGLRGKPRTLGVPGENQPKIHSLLEDPDEFRGQAVCVTGGGDSALEAAAALADAGAKVLLSYRGRSFNRAAPKNKQTIESYEAQRRIKVKYQSQIVEFGVESVIVQMADGSQKQYPNHASFVLIGADPPVKWLSKLGIEYVERPHMHSTGSPHELVQRFVPDVPECPETAASAAAYIKGQAVADDFRASRSQVAAKSGDSVGSAGRALSGVGKLEQPMPLSQFAKENRRRHRGDGRRDKLDARERTRVLRMLRDEGGRLAHEDSQLYLLDDSVERSAVVEEGRMDSLVGGSPAAYQEKPSRAKGKVTAGRSAERPRGAGEEYAPLTLPPGEGFLDAPPDSNRSPAELQPKEAVIVGLAKANSRHGGARRDTPQPLADHRAAASEWDKGPPAHLADQAPLSFEDSDVHEMTKMLDSRMAPPPSADELADFEDEPTRAIDTQGLKQKLIPSQDLSLIHI